MKTKVFVTLLAMIIIMLTVALSWYIYNSRKLNNLTASLNELLMQAKLEIGKGKTEFGNAQSKISELEKEIQNEINKNNEIMTKYSQLLAKYSVYGGGTAGGNIAVISQPISIEKNLFIPKNIYVATSEKQIQSFGQKINFDFSDGRANIKSEIWSDDNFNIKNKIDYNLRLKVLVRSAETITKTGSVNNYITVYEIDGEGNRLGKFDLVSYDSIVNDQRTSHFSWINPKIDIGAFVGFDGELQYGASLGVSLSSYGLTDNDISWRLFHVAAMFGNNTFIGFSPALWNAGNPLPVLQNIWIGPQMTFDVGKFNFGFSITINALL